MVGLVMCCRKHHIRFISETYQALYKTEEEPEKKMSIVSNDNVYAAAQATLPGRRRPAVATSRTAARSGSSATAPKSAVKSSKVQSRVELTLPGFQKVAAMMFGVAKKSALSYAQADLPALDRLVRQARAGFQMAQNMYEQLLDQQTGAARNQLVMLMNRMTMAVTKVEDFCEAAYQEAGRRDQGDLWVPHPFGEDNEPVMAKSVFVKHNNTRRAVRGGRR